MAEQLRYSREELKEFEELLLEKLNTAKKELEQMKSVLNRSAVGEDDSSSGFKSIDDSVDLTEREQLNQLAARTQKYITQLQNALIRIKNGTYGICIDSGRLIGKDRLRAVPHTQHSIEAKKNKV